MLDLVFVVCFSIKDGSGNKGYLLAIAPTSFAGTIAERMLLATMEPDAFYQWC
jgi:hypothetical protein